MDAHVTWNKGGDALFTKVDDDLVTLSSTRSSAPGSRIEGALAGGERVFVKIFRCRRTSAEHEPPRFLLEGRLLDATRGFRDVVAALLSPNEAPQATEDPGAA